MFLVILVALPLAAAGIMALTSSGPQGSRLALVLGALLVAAGLPLLTLDAPLATATWSWFQIPGTSAMIELGLRADGLSSWMVQLITISSMVALAIQARQNPEHIRSLAIGTFIAAGMMLGVVLSTDLVLFYICYEAMLAPALVLMLLQGDADRRRASTRLVLYTMLFSMFLLVAIWYLAADAKSSNIDVVLNNLPSMGSEVRWWLFVGMVTAFAVKIPLLPLHGWQASAYASAPTAVTVLLAGAMGKMGVYGLMRLVLPGFDYEIQSLMPWLLGIAGVTVIYGALVAVVQEDLKRLLAYASLSHLALVVLGLFTGSDTAYAGALVQMVAHTLAVGALLAVISWLEDVHGSRDLARCGGLARRSPILASLLLVAALATMAMPGTAAFVGEFMLLLGAYHSGELPLLALAVIATSVVLAAWYMLRLLRGVLFQEHEAVATLPVAAVAWTAAPLLIMSIVLGFWATPITGSVTVIDERTAEQTAAPAADHHLARAAGRLGDDS